MTPFGTPIDKQFAFVSVNEPPAAGSRKKIRAHAMREALRQKRAGTIVAPGQTASISYHTGRFRLSDSSAAYIDDPEINENDINRKGDRTSIPTKDSAKPNSFSTGNGKLLMVPSRGHIDPFDSLSITLGREQQAILHCCKYNIQSFGCI